MSTVRRITIGGLDAFDVGGPGDGPTIVLLHGYGADANDLLPLHAHMSAPTGTRWIVPDAPLSLGISPLFGGRAWFHIDQAALEQAMTTGSHRDRSKTTPVGLDEARETVMQVLAELGTPLSKVVLAGFSQGAMVATEVALSLPTNVAAMVLFSGTLLHEDVWRAMASRHGGLRFYQSHGRHDPLLSIDAARRLNELLNGSGLTGQLHEFPGQHEIPMVVLNAAATFIDETLRNRQSVNK